MTPAWDALIGAFERAAGGAPTDVATLEPLVSAAISDGTVDNELDPHQTARLLSALAAGTHGLGPSDSDVATALMVATRWLHPPRLGARREPGPAV
ncbi:hypothetical protein [Aeromicrobium sp. Leaf350]|uniref:hypothetical protein n=1 Tax=Aeromicrobium sp. Leaf350 TaxID=2876565 RepID=UPI001E3A6C29|nr:hypothetical protein [Aeromicrobium sp. Leaf350]